MEEVYLAGCRHLALPHTLDPGDQYTDGRVIRIWINEDHEETGPRAWVPRLEQWLDLIVELAIEKNPTRADEYLRSGHRDALQAITTQMNATLQGGTPGISAEFAALRVFELLRQL